MRFCSNCGKAVSDSASFCEFCGAPMAAAQPEPQPVYEAASVVSNAEIAEEQEFLDVTHRLMRWEQKAWNICGTVFMILGIFFISIFSLLFLAGVASADVGGGFLSGMMFIYIVIYAAFLIIGIIEKQAAKKYPIILTARMLIFAPHIGVAAMWEC